MADEGKCEECSCTDSMENPLMWVPASDEDRWKLLCWNCLV